MSGDAHFSGSIEIVPPLNWAEIRQAHKLPYVKAKGMPHDTRNVQIMIDVHEGEEHTDQGVSVTKMAFYIKPVATWYTAYRAQEAIQSIVDAFGEARTFPGYIEERAEDNSWHHRFVVQDGVVRKLKPVIDWVDVE